jgi:magnesium-transporting ATPase (P-type)
LQDFTLRILLVCACVSIILEVSTATESNRDIAWVDGFAIFFAVFVCSTVQAGNDYQKEKQFQKLYKVADDKKMVEFN